MKALFKKLEPLKEKKKQLFIIATVLIFSLFIALFLPFKADGKNKKKSQPIPKVVNGVIDFSSNTIYENESIEVKGDWDFFNQKFLKTEDIVNNKIPKKSGTLYFPGTANQFPVKKGSKETIGPYGYGTFLLKVRGIKKNFPFSFL